MFVYWIYIKYNILKKTMNTIYIMSSIHLTVKENVVIEENEIIEEPYPKPDQSLYGYGGSVIFMKTINEKDQDEVCKEMRRLIDVRMKYNPHTPPKPDHIKWEDYGFEKKAEYKAAKDKHYKDYQTRCGIVEKHISYLSSLNTYLCYEAKKKADAVAVKEGKYFNSDEKEYLRLKEEHRKASRKVDNAIYYKNHKEQLGMKRKLKEIKSSLSIAKNDDNVLLCGSKIIKPLCQCGRQCDLSKIESIKKHSNIEKHRLFKSIIALIHYKRRNGVKLKPIIDKLNNDYKDYKRVVREKRNGKSVTITNKTDKEIIQLYGDYLNPMDENETHQPRKSYIEKVEYTQDYKDCILLIRFEKNKRTKNK